VATSMLPTAVWRNEGIAHFSRNDFANALVYFDQCLSVHSADRDLLNYKARTLEALGRLEDSLSCIERCLEIEPNNVAELGNRAVLLTKLSRRAEALASLDKVLILEPDHVEVLIRRAHVLHRLGRRDEALSSAERAVLAAPRDLAALNMKGMILDEMGRHAEALADFEAILAVNPDCADAITNRGIVHGRSGEFREALRCYDRSLSINPSQPNAVYNRAVVKLVLGDWAAGFREFESRWKIFPHEAARLTRLAPRWLGQTDIKGKSILLHHEQGFGDAIQFSRYVPLVMRLGARVILAAPAGLRKLLETLPGAPRIVSEGERIPAHDFHCPLMSLPLAFGTTPENAPGDVPYLRADPNSVQIWSERLGVRSRPRIGLVWSGRRYPPINYARDMTFESVRPLLALDADFACLHTELSAEERAALAKFPHVTWFGEQLTDFADTAALIANLDLVITVDTAVAHLAGALGKPVWVMNRYASCWRWLLGRADSPWYPSLRLFRQSTLGDWNGVIQNVLRAAGAFMAAFAHRDRIEKTAVTTHPAARDLGFQEMLQRALDFHNLGQLTEAIDIYEQIQRSNPTQADTLHYLGVALAQQGRFEEALVPLVQALETLPGNAAVHNHYGNALAGLGRYEDALLSYERAVACDGSLADGHYNRGATLTELGRTDEALASYERAIQLNPNNAQAYNNRGNLLADAGSAAEALVAYEQAIEARPRFVDAWINRSHLLRRLHRYEEALASSESALECDPRHPGAHNVRGAILADLGRDEEALRSYERALEHSPNFSESIWNKGLIELSRGQLKEGFVHYESRWAVKSLKIARRYPVVSQWQGSESVRGKVVLLHAEQGYGDTIQFSRYCALVAARGARVVLGVPEALRSLFRGLAGVQEIVAGSAVPSFDFHCSLMSLPHVLGTDIGNIPATARYLRADSGAKDRWRGRLSTQGARLQVGLAWSGRITHTNDFNRSLSLEQFLPVTRPDIQWISLQKEVRGTDEAHLAGAPAIARFGEELRDFADAAALIENLDLVITVDTAVAHLAGALGIPVWVLLPYVADWRWLRDREDSPWYPSARLFRQHKRCAWTPVIEQVAIELDKLLSAKGYADPPSKATKVSPASRAHTRKQ
jgi:tetratricopeptide (TPR) repeat protein